MRMLPGWVGAVVALGGTGFVVVATPGRAAAQAVAFAPTIGTVPEGVGMNVTPVVSADRRYVRLSVSAGFSAVGGFQNINIPLGAVAGGPGPGGGGMGGGAGFGGGGGGGGFPSMGVPLGMDGPIMPGMGMGSGANPAMMGWNGATPGYANPNSAAGWDDWSWSPAPRRARTTRGKSVRPKPATPPARTSAKPQVATPPATPAAPAPASAPVPSPR